MEYLTREEHAEICKIHHDQAMAWAKEAVSHSADDRTEIKRRVCVLEKFREKATWGVMAGLALTLFSIWAAPYISRNGDSQRSKDMIGYIAVLSQTVEQQQELIKKGNEVSENNQRKLERLEQEIKRR